MGRRGKKPKVNWWAKRQGGGYFATLDGKKVCLALGPDDAPSGPTYLKALDEFARLMRQERNKGTDGYAVAALLNAWRQKLADNGQAAMLKNANIFLKSFSDRCGNLAVAELLGRHADEWLQAATAWNSSSKRLAVKMLSAALNWGAKKGLVASNPLKGKLDMPRDRPRGRECRLAAEFAGLLIDEAPPAFARLLRMLHGTGARPLEIESATAKDFKGDRIVYRWDAAEGYRHKAAQRGREVDRVIFLTAELAALCRELLARHPVGPIFRTAAGTPWSRRGRCQAWGRLLGRPAVRQHMQEHGVKRGNVVPYSFRHTWISQWIDTGRSIKLCADLCGTSVAMIEKHYGHADEENLQAVYLAFMSGAPLNCAGSPSAAAAAPSPRPGAAERSAGG